MALSDGMVAVVRSAESPGGLCVTLVEGNRQYTLMPNSEVPLRMQSNVDPYPRKTQSTGTQKTSSTYTKEPRPRNSYDSSAQAVDGQYASIYKMAHCNLQPTSPPAELTEFPPQRPEVYPGQENFVIGGCGSGNANHSLPRNSTSFRMGTNWPAQGTPSPRCPRSAHRPDAFANSLRNYPSMSPERSAEVIERLVNYSNTRNNRLSPDRLLMPKNYSQCSKFSTFTSDQYQQIDGLGRSPRAEIYDESPTRDRWHCDEEKRFLPSRCDVRSMTEAKMKDFPKVVSSYPANLCPTIMERLNHIPSKYSNNMLPVNRHHSVNMETQAAVPTVSREIATVPRSPPEVRNVAVFVSPASSSPSNSDSQHRKLKIIQHSKSISIQTQISNVLILRKKSVQTCFSSVNLRNKKKIGHKRKSKSQVELKIDDDLDEQIVQIIEDLTKPSVHLRSKLKKLRKQKHDKHEPKTKGDKRENEQLLFSERNLKEFTRELSNDLLSKIKRQNIIMQPTDRYRANYFDLFKTNDERCSIDEIVIDWLDEIPVKRTDYLGRPVVKEHILKTVGEKVQNKLINKLKYISEASTKADIIDVLEDLPIDVTGHTRRFFLNKLVTELISKVKNSTSKKERKNLQAFCNYIQLKDEEIKQFIENEVIGLQRKFSLLICQDTVGHMINELTAILLDSMEAIRRGKMSDVIDEVLTITSEFLTISEFQSIYFAHNLVYNLFQQSNCNEPHANDFLCYSSQIQEKVSNNSNYSKENETVHDDTANSSDFTRHVAVQVNEWLSSIKGIEKLGHSSRLVVVNDLTGDIVDRQKYLEMNPSLPKAGDEELEHLKYQIFKWVNKVLGDDNTDTLLKAPDLLKRIKSIPVTQTKSQEQVITVMPMSTTSNVQNEQREDNSSNVSNEQRNDHSSNAPNDQRKDHSSNVPNEQRKESRPNSQLNQSRIRPAVSRSTTVPSATQNKSLNQLNEEYDAYVKDWVQRVPIAVTKPEDEAIAEKARLGLYIGVWKAITKLKMSPETLDNPYYYQDALDDEIEILLQCLPQTPEFKTKKHVLKPDLIENTMLFNERVANVAGRSSYRQQLVANVSNILPKQTDINIAGKNTDRLYEEWQKNMLAELYILYNRFKIDDRVKAIAYKKKLMRHIEKLIDNIKGTTKQELKELDHHTYQDEILAALDEVPIPSDETLNEEAGEILVLLEVEQWFRDLPLLPSKRETAHIESKVFQDLLARKLYDIDAHCNPTKRTDLMKQEIRRFLERLPLREEEKPNMNFMIDELLNRLNNVNSDVVAVGGENERKSVNLLEGYDYDSFSRNLPVSSTFEGNPPRDQFDGSSYLITEGERVPDEQDWQMIRDPTGRSEQYLTIEGLTGPRMASCSASSAPPTPQNVCIPPSDQFLSPYQGPIRTEQTKNDNPPVHPGTSNVTSDGQASSRSIQITEDPVSNFSNQNQSGYGPLAGGYDPNGLQPPPVDLNKTAMSQQYKTSPMPSSQREDCCSMPNPQDYGASTMPKPQQYGICGMPTPQDNEGYATPRHQVNGAYTIPSPQRVDCCGMPIPRNHGASAMRRPQQYGTCGMPTPQDNGAYDASRPQGSSTPQDLKTSGTCPIPKPQQTGTRAMPTPQDNRASAMPRPQDNDSYSTSRPQSGTSAIPRSQLPGYGTYGMPTPQDNEGYAMPRQQVNGATIPTPKRADCCGTPTPQDYWESAMPRPQQYGTSGMPIPQDNAAYGISRPQDLKTSGTCPMPKIQPTGTRVMPTPQDNGAPAMSRPQDNESYSTSRPQSGTSAMPRSQLPGCCLTPNSDASTIQRPQEQRVSITSKAIHNGSSGMPIPQSSSTQQDFRTIEQGTNPIPRTLDSGTTPPCCKSARRSSAPPSYKPSKSQYQYSVPPVPDPYTPYSTPDNEEPQDLRKYRKERRESARRKLRFDESENDSDEFGCRCMEKVWRCRRRKPVCEMRRYIPCEEMPCFMRMREYYRS